MGVSKGPALPTFFSPMYVLLGRKKATKSSSYFSVIVFVFVFYCTIGMVLLQLLYYGWIHLENDVLSEELESLCLPIP